jgi:hypothetical protein
VIVRSVAALFAPPTFPAHLTYKPIRAKPIAVSRAD